MTASRALQLNLVQTVSCTDPAFPDSFTLQVALTGVRPSVPPEGACGVERDVLVLGPEGLSFPLVTP